MEEESQTNGRYKHKRSIINVVREATHVLIGTAEDYNPLIDRIGDAHFVLIGEASHGTHEFYQQRAEITKRLFKEKGFTVVAVEADWPDAYRVNRYVHGIDDDATSTDALMSFTGFPTWMWCNADVVHFIDWLRSHNDAFPSDTRKVGFYGLDLYSLYTSPQTPTSSTPNRASAQEATCMVVLAIELASLQGNIEEATMAQR